MKHIDFIPKEKRVWFVGETLNQTWDDFYIVHKNMTQKERRKSKRVPRKPCECVLVGWLLSSDAYIYYTTQSENDDTLNFYAAVYAGKNETYHHELADYNEKPYLIYLLGHDDGSIGLRFKTEEEMKDHLELLESVDDVMEDKNMLLF